MTPHCLIIQCSIYGVNFVTRELMILIIYFTADASGSLYIILRSRKTQNAYVLVFGEAKSEWFYVRKNQDWRFNISSHPSASYIQHVVRVVNVCEWRFVSPPRVRAHCLAWIDWPSENIEIPEFQEFHLWSLSSKALRNLLSGISRRS